MSNLEQFNNVVHKLKERRSLNIFILVHSLIRVTSSFLATPSKIPLNTNLSIHKTLSRAIGETIIRLVKGEIPSQHTKQSLRDDCNVISRNDEVEFKIVNKLVNKENGREVELSKKSLEANEQQK